MTSTLESMKHSPRAIKRATVVTHGKPQTIGPALARVAQVAREHGVELILPEEEQLKHGLEAAEVTSEESDIAVVLGGDGTMLRALARFLGTDVPVIGVNFGRVGFLASIPPDDIESGLARVFDGDYRVEELPTLEAEIDGKRFVAVNDVVATSGTLGRMIQLEWNVGGEELGRVSCDGVIAATPSGSTAYNLSNGGPVVVRGLDAMVVTFIAPHSLHARPLVTSRGTDLILWNRTPDVDVAVLVDGHATASLGPSGRVIVRLCAQRGLLASLPETTFFRRYRETFGS